MMLAAYWAQMGAHEKQDEMTSSVNLSHDKRGRPDESQLQVTFELTMEGEDLEALCTISIHPSVPVCRSFLDPLPGTYE